MALEFMNNIFFWIIAFFTTVVILILQMVIFILIKLKTHAFVELKAFFKKSPISLFFDDGKFLDMKATPVDTGIISDSEYGVFVRNRKNSYLGKKTRNIYDVYDLSFSPGINVKAAHSAQVLRGLVSDEDEYEKIGELVTIGQLKDEKLDCLRTNVVLGEIKNLFNYIEPHNINASVEKKVAAKIRSSMKGNNGMSTALIFIAVLGAIVAAYILLKMFSNK